eukprot:CAMPEP_0198141596 /NCGR_PEP_ID=MMETSP1443-20131203/4584_1 /TAXON_ID=186043 /ORGANISM="Entomoneis sp., Strain CCMP2396" /LENGTH=39 /DNA_ID= /DNA_START= /DNA_END= /DNA_ORIENTATION=
MKADDHDSFFGNDDDDDGNGGEDNDPFDGDNKGENEIEN